MFSQGQWIFAAIFLIGFIIVTIFMYRRDAFLHAKHYSKSWLILIGFLLFLALLFFIKLYTH